MTVQILGVKNSEYIELLGNLQNALDGFEKKTKLKEINTVREILEFDLLSTPALMVENRVLKQGQVISSEEIRTLLSGFNKAVKATGLGRK